MSEEDTQQRTAEGEARAAEHAENLAMTDARRAEEEVAKAEAETEAAREKEEKLSRKERKAREQAGPNQALDHLVVRHGPGVYES